MGQQQARTPVLVILGPTASGKTAIAVELARRAQGEIISADSRAFYIGLDIVTDKPTIEERAGIPHHLIDCVPIDGNYDVMAFRSDVRRLLPEIRSRNRRPIIAGGGTLYLGAILRGIFEGAVKDEALRSAMKESAIEDLYFELKSVDPAAAGKIHPNDRLRITRALEVYRATGKRMSEWQSEAVPLREDFRVVGLHRERSEHRALIERRIRQMMDRGVIEEIARLRADGLTQDVQAYRTIGVPEAFAVLDGEMAPEEYVEAVSSRTWQLARRQTAWFHRDKTVRWIDVTGKTIDDVVDRVVSEWCPTAEPAMGEP
ncbi:tRNA (adenosine(37)-N6)-dimethylallyltransferase MiaA [Candidatus Bipolaricaulota bacterium]